MQQIAEAWRKDRPHTHTYAMHMQLAATKPQPQTWSWRVTRLPLHARSSHADTHKHTCPHDSSPPGNAHARAQETPTDGHAPAHGQTRPHVAIRATDTHTCSARSHEPLRRRGTAHPRAPISSTAFPSTCGMRVLGATNGAGRHSLAAALRAPQGASESIVGRPKPP